MLLLVLGIALPPVVVAAALRAVVALPSGVMLVPVDAAVDVSAVASAAVAFAAAFVAAAAAFWPLVAASSVVLGVESVVFPLPL